MCDYSLHHVRSRPAKVGDTLTTRDFNLGTVGFAASEDESVAVCVLPGTELYFASEVRCLPRTLGWNKRVCSGPGSPNRFSASLSGVSAGG